MSLNLFGVTSYAADFYLGPQFGKTSYTPPTGEKDRVSEYSYGGDVMAFKGPYGAGFHLSYLPYPTDGNATVSVQQSDLLMTLEAKYRYEFNNHINPYVTFGAGSLYKTVKSSVMGMSEKSSDFYFVQDIGLGIMGVLFKDFGYNAAVKYYQYSNVDGYNYTLSLGYFSSHIL
ncbi:MAG: outer membrane beta-barrel protein [Oligoflexia bacterium]|nr:outer membrane beta-barrel protein [Oligoflexia bacterium]